MIMNEKESWMTPIIASLKWAKLLNNKKEVRKVEHQSMYFFIENRYLYKKSFALLSLWCLNPNKARYIIKAIHEGIYRSHLARTIIALKAIRARYYWPQMKQEALDMVHNYDMC